jgi:hypothetical protein
MNKEISLTRKEFECRLNENLQSLLQELPNIDIPIILIKNKEQKGIEYIQKDITKERNDFFGKAMKVVLDSVYKV